GDTRRNVNNVGPEIDDESKANLDDWLAEQERADRVRFRWDRYGRLPADGTYVAPAIVELDGVAALDREVFGPVLHVVRWQPDRLDTLLDDIATNGTALTL